jgi:hypothetical protein
MCGARRPGRVKPPDAGRRCRGTPLPASHIDPAATFGVTIGDIAGAGFIANIAPDMAPQEE